MLNCYKKLTVRFALILAMSSIQTIYGQCNLTYYAGIGVANAGTNFATWSGFGPGQYFAWPVLFGGSYGLSTCGAGVNTQLTGWDNSASSVIFLNTGNGPFCSGSNASINNFVPNFTGYCYVQLTQYYCGPGGSSSVNLYLRQNDNIVFTSSSAAMCSGQTRALSATPANVGSTPGGYGDPGTFSGTGVSGNVFTAPVVASPTNYTITYTFGYVSHTQVITVNPLPTVGATTSSATICRGASTTLNGTGASTYTWTGGVTNGVPFSPNSSGTYFVSGTSAAGCTSTNSASQLITVNSLPTVAVGVTSSVICDGTATTLNGSGATTYTWTGPSGTVPNGAPFSPTVTASYTLTGTSAAGCTSTNAPVQTITVNPRPTLAASATNSVICFGVSTTLNGSGAGTYTWTGPSGTVPNATPFTPTITATYTLTGTSAAGCTATTSAVQGVTVNPLPVLAGSVSNSVICFGATSTLNGSGANTYTWTGPSGNVLNGTPFVPSATANYTLTGTSSAGCTGTNLAVQGITVNILPVVGVSATNSVICDGFSTTLNGSGASTYTWTGPSGTVPNGSPFSPTTTASYTLSGTSTAGCTSTNAPVQLITVNPRPILVASTSSAVICAGATTTLNGSGASTYTWTGPTGIVPNGTPFTPAGPGTYTLTGTSAAGCTGTNLATQGITLITLPLVTAGTNTYICFGGSITLNGGGANTYIWAGPSGAVPDGVPFSPTVTATYTVTGTSVSGCTNTAARTVSVYALPFIFGVANTSAVCIGASDYLLGAGAVTYTWTGPSGNVPNITPFTPTATAIYTLAGTDNFGCTNSGYTVQIVVNPLPIVSGSTTNSVVCSGGTTILNGSGASTYTWTGLFSAIVPNGVPFVPPYTTSYSLAGTSAAGCTSTNSAGQLITVNPLPTVTAAATNSVICFGANTTLNGGGANTYTWTGPSGNVPNGTPFIPASTAIYTVAGTSTAGCTSTNLATQAVTVIPLPSVSVAVTFSQVCIAQSVTFNGSGANTYTLIGPSGVVPVGSPFTPTATGFYILAGTSLAGCTSTNAPSQLVTVVPRPTMIPSTTNSVICFGASTTLNGGGANTYTWTSPTGTVPNGVPFTPSVTASYTLTGTSLAGCTNTNVAIQTITVNALPVLTGTVTNPVVCYGNTVALNAGGANTYTWTGPAGTIPNGSSFTPSITTSYTLTGTSTAGCTGTNTVVRTVTVNQLPLVFGVASATVICNTSTVSLLGAGAITYTWTTPTGTVPNNTPFTPSVTNAYSLTGTDASGCTSTLTPITIIIVNALPVVSVTATNPVICMGGTTTLNGAGASTYTWTGGVTDGISFSPTSTTSYSVTGTNSAGCTSTNNAVQTITVNPLPIISVANQTICIGATATLTAGGAATYSWNTGALTNTLSDNPPVTTNYTVTGIDINSCVNTQTASIVIVSVPVISANSTTICAGETATLIASGATTYTWNTTAQTNSITVSPATTTVYTVDGFLNGCAVQAIGATVTVNVNQLPVLTAATGSSVICNGQTVQLNLGGASAYSLDAVPVTPPVSISPNVTTVYSIIGTDLNGCTSSTTFTQEVSDCVGMTQHISSNTEIKLYPNPNNGKFTISGAGSMQLSIINELGQTINVVNLNADNNYLVHINNLAKGIYFVIGTSNNEAVKRKIIVAE